MAGIIGGFAPYLALALLALLFAGFIAERYPPDVTAAAGAAAFMVFGLVPFDSVMEVFSNSAPITIAAMFVISGAMVRTGLLDAVADAVVRRAETRPGSALAIFFAAVVGLSAFVNNTPLVLILIPVVIRLSTALEVAPTRLLIPLSYAAILGGTCTLIGTSTNLLVDGVAREAGLPPFSIFEIAPVGVVVAVIGMGTLGLLGRGLLPARESTGSVTTSDPRFLTELQLWDGCPFLGRPIRDVAELSRPGVRVLAVRRSGRLSRQEVGAHVLASGDGLVVSTTAAELLTFNYAVGISAGQRRAVPVGTHPQAVVAEAIVAPTRAFVDARVSELGLGRRYGVRVLGIHRHRHVPGADLGSTRLRAADRLLLEGPAEGFDAIAQAGDLLSITRPSARAYRRGKAPIALFALLGVVALAALGVAGIGILAMLAVVAILVLRCIDNDEAWGSIDASILILIFSMLIVGAGLEATGAVELVVGAIVPFLDGFPPVVLLIAVYATASILTELVTNNAVAVIMTPIVIALAIQTGADPRPFVVAVMFGASASFATPIGYQTNTLVYGAGNYRFSDFLKVGTPMNIIVGAASILAIWFFFPLAP